jgi:DNA-binding CsgD family transcriptional regulator
MQSQRGASCYGMPRMRPPRLSVRQLEALRWTAQGKTSWEAAVIMRCTEATVNYHLKQVFRKLEVVNKTHAVSKALDLGLLRETATISDL